MTLKEIEEQLDRADKAPVPWDNLPRCLYRSLPKKLQIQAREAFPPKRILEGLRELYLFEPDRLQQLTGDLTPSNLEKVLVRTRNTAVYTLTHNANFASGLELAIYMDHLESAFLEAVRALNREDTTRTTEPTLTTVPYYQSIISDKKYQFALTAKKNGAAYLVPLQDSFFQVVDMHEGGADWSASVRTNLNACRLSTWDGKVRDIDIPLLNEVFTAILETKVSTECTLIRVDARKFLKSMGVDSKHGMEALMEKLQAFSGFVGIFPKESLKSVLQVSEYDSKTGILTFNSPYLFAVCQKLKEENKREETPGKPISYKPYINRLVHASIVSERCRGAVEIVYLVTSMVQARGARKDDSTTRGGEPGIFTYQKSFKTLIEETVFLRGQLQNCAKDQNRILERTFRKAYELFRKKTDIYQRYNELEIQETIPTMKNLGAKLIVRHKGLNPLYEPKT